MVTCEICSKEVKTTQALRGHMNFVHGKFKRSESPAVLHQALDTANLDDICDIIMEAVEQHMEPRIDSIATSVTELTGRLARLAELESRVKVLEMRLPSVEAEVNKLQSQGSTVEGKLSEANREIGSVKFSLQLHEKCKHPRPRECTGLQGVRTEARFITCRGTKG